MRIPFIQVDAFADAPFAGNPAAVMPLSAWLADDVLQAIAEENNLSETAFIVPSATDGVDFDLRWFTPIAEVALCGHATLASGHVVLSSDTALSRVRFATRQAGVIEVARVDDGYALALPAWGPDAADLTPYVDALALTDVEATLWHEKGYALIVVGDAATVRALDPDQRAVKAAGQAVVIVTAPGDTTDIVSRVFTPAYGIDEDPVTGSAHAVMVPYWAKRLGRDDFTAYQASARGGRLTCRHDGDRVILGGHCVTVIEGTFLLP
ncbi:PhzF family phenazine biosynthesis protein [Sphingomonas oligophenolica]|uniref:PhzF family phenazine biosynthesis protein n=1 Tax=Sphingomonas oligophenolica TaxID=301154 RepID=A0A502CBD9_9SPHN|nr:PhzF family phenazine biosynthesis protein [Sphingomonas oligophenolica]TPG10010.1 PhzF family phenazine biosynthesis protein [Sphingomonas oligophenolica]